MNYLPTDADERAQFPMFDGLLGYFPAALAWVSRCSKVGNDQHNPGEPLHWAMDKSTDHKNKIVKHLLDVGTDDTDDVPHSVKVAWRALALAQEDLMARKGAPAPHNGRKEHRRVATPDELAGLKHVELQMQEDPRAGMVNVDIRASEPATPKFLPYSHSNPPQRGHRVRVVKINEPDDYPHQIPYVGCAATVLDDSDVPLVEFADGANHVFEDNELERIG